MPFSADPRRGAKKVRCGIVSRGRLPRGNAPHFLLQRTT
jgi:hypothetical protein